MFSHPRQLFNVVMVSVSFMLVFTAFNTMGTRTPAALVITVSSCSS